MFSAPPGSFSASPGSFRASSESFRGDAELFRASFETVDFMRKMPLDALITDNYHVL